MMFVSAFTFQYVSINTHKAFVHFLRLFNFTFQYVSINTVLTMINSGLAIFFTFQYVSINTYDRRQK